MRLRLVASPPSQKAVFVFYSPKPKVPIRKDQHFETVEGLQKAATQVLKDIPPARLFLRAMMHDANVCYSVSRLEGSTYRRGSLLM